MIEYNTKKWFSTLFRMGNTHVLKKLLPSVFAMGFYTAACVYVFQHYISANFKGTTTVHSLLGIVLGLLLVFRTNTAYDRWWEGRRLWGSLVNNSRNLSLKLDTLISSENKELRDRFIKLIINFSFALKSHLRGKVNIEKLDLPNIDNLENKKHIPNAIAQKIFYECNNLYKDQIISGEQLIIIDKHVSELTDITGACERIRNTPIPFSYNMHLKKYIFFYVITLPWGLVNDLKYLSVPAIMLIFYAMVGLELIGEEIEDPFGYDADDLPLDKICQTIKTNVHEILS